MKGNAMDDSKIIELFFDRSENAIAELDAKYGKACRRLSMNILNNELDAEECVNDTYLSAWNTIPPKNPDPLSAYVFRLVKNFSLNRYKYNNAEHRKSNYGCNIDELSECIPGSENPENTFIAEELTKSIERFVAGLDEINRMIFVRHFWYLDSYEDIAAKSGLRQNTIRTRVSRVKNSLTKHLKKEGFTL